MAPTQRSSITLGVVWIVAGVGLAVPFVVPDAARADLRALAGALVVLAGGLCVVAGLRSPLSVGSVSLTWRHLDGIACLVALAGTWLTVLGFRLGPGREAPLVLIAYFLVLTGLVLGGVAVELLTGGLYLFPDLEAES